MTRLAGWFKQNLWAIFVLHQLFIFITAWSFLSVVRIASGREIHLGRDPIGIVDGIALVCLSAFVIVFTRSLYYRVKGKDAESLGIQISFRRLIDLLVGLLVGFAFAILPWANALLSGRAEVKDRIGAHFEFHWILIIISGAFFLLLIQGAVEEIANRTFPMRLWEHRSLLFRLIVPAVFFAAIHLAGEQFAFERVGLLLAGGIIHGLAYALTGNIWLTTGLHTGGNYALFSISGSWYAGAIFRVTGQPSFSGWISTSILLVLFIAAYILMRHFKPEQVIR